MDHGAHWAEMNAQPRRRATELARGDVPTKAGVYAWYRRGRAVYVGKGDELLARAWGDHMSQSRSMHTSAFRRNVAERLGFGLAADIYAKRVRLNTEQLAAVRTWIMGCSVAWIECANAEAARRLECDMKAAWMPPLTKR